MDYSKFYDKTDVNSIVEYSKKLEGKTFADVILEKVGGSHEEIMLAYGNKARKGGLGNLLEEIYYGYKANSKQDADFEEAGVELKVTCYEIKQNGDLRAGERLVLTMISYDSPVERDFYKSHAWKKMSKIMLIYYWRNKLLNQNLLYKIGYTKLFTPPEEDLVIIRNDYLFIINKIEAGKAHELSEADTMYLGACTKGSTAEKSTVPQYYGNHTPAMKRAFCFKNSYMTYVLNHYVIGIETEEKIIKDANEIGEKPFGEILMERLNAYRGIKDCVLAEKYSINVTNKGYRALLAYAMLGVKGNRAEEFIKANIEVKTVRLNKYGRNPEHFRLHDFDFKELAAQEWEDSDLYEQLEGTQFLLVVYQETDDGIVYAGSQLWHMNQKQIEIVHQGWEAVKKKLNEGVTLTVETKADGSVIVHNDLPKITDNPIFHIRPHQQQAYYRLKDGQEYGKGTISNGNQLPDGQYMPTHAYWLHSKFISDILDKRFIHLKSENE